MLWYIGKLCIREVDQLICISISPSTYVRQRVI